ncbi:MAG: dockerin type I repeat-containing protein, partial [Oscillospiraceae bacterium]|nr:dockerin type I repeat-containing protein [Oscillospiraceae bacterium]
PHDDWNQIIYGYDQDYLPLCTRVKRDGLPGQPGFEVVFDEWCTVTLEFDGEDNIFDNQNGPQDGPIAGALVSILNRGPEGENVYIRSLRVWATDQPEREVSVVFGKTGVIPPYSIRDELKVWIDRCSALDPNDFVQDDKWMTMQIRLSEAIALYDYWSIPRITIWPPNPPPPTEYELMVALNRLISAYKALTPIKNPGTDRTFLDAAVSAAKKKQDEADFEEYCNLSKFNLAAALAAGENLYWDSDQEEIDAAADAITAALASNTAMRLKGDIDGDGEITVSDVRAVLQHVVGKAEITDPLSLSAAKVDGAGETVGIGDARMILQKLVGKIEDWP